MLLKYLWQRFLLQKAIHFLCNLRAQNESMEGKTIERTNLSKENNDAYMAHAIKETKSYNYYDISDLPDLDDTPAHSYKKIEVMTRKPVSVHAIKNHKVLN